MTQNDIALRNACVLAEELYWENFFKNAGDITERKSSDNLDKRIMSLIYGNEYAHNEILTAKKHKSKKAAVIIAAILAVLISVTAFAFSPVKSYFIEIYNDGTKFIFLNEKKKDYFYSTFTYIPEGYELTQHTKGKFSQRSVYNNGNKRIIIDTDPNGHSVRFIDTENAETGDIVINGCDGYYSITDDAVILVWTTGKYNHCIIADLNGDIITLDEVIKIAESRQPLK